MSSRCPDGHLSGTDDFCDECGTPIPAGARQPPAAGTPGAQASGARPPAAPLPAGPNDAGVRCPCCGQPIEQPAERYCEACGYDFVTGTAPLAAPPVPFSLPPTGATPPPPAPLPVPAPPGGEPAGWLAEVVPDRPFFDRGDDESGPFPADTPPRLVPLLGGRTLIGRRSRSRGIFPRIDLSLPPEDLGVSRAHALLDHGPAGPLTVTDLGSANGTWVGDDPRPLTRGVAVELTDGARLYLGSWTRITLHQR